ncbi:MAG: hypothetical protein Q7V57_01230 [Actinomycetota bacterium]|nr:hypothetical protein [Actinomycetota bacterium]
MGLFSKKPNPVDTESAAAVGTPGRRDKPTKPGKPAPQPAAARAPRKVDPADFFALRGELADLKARLEASEQAKSIVEARLAALDATTTAIAANRLGGDDVRARINELEGQLHGVVATANAAASAAEMAATKAATVSAAASALQQHVATDPALLARVEALAARVEAIPTAAPVAPAPLAPTVDDQLLQRVNDLAAKVQAADGLAAQIAQLAERIAANDTTTRQAVEQVNTLEQRLAAVSTELANQVSELGSDIDGLAAHKGELATGEVGDELIDALKSAQVKLAAEQARYEITFRNDLAALAEQVRRGLHG